MIKRILVTLSATRYTAAAIEHAVELAQAHGAELYGVTDINDRVVEQVGMVPIGGGKSAMELVEYRRQTIAKRIAEVIDDFERAAGAANVRYSVHPEHGEPFEQITRLWRYCDLTVCGLQGLFEYDIIRSPKDVLIRLLRTGVRPIVAVAEQHRAVHDVLVAYNGSMESAKAMKRFVQMRLWPDVRMHIVCFGFTPDEARPLLQDAAEYCQLHGYEVDVEGRETTAVDDLLPTVERTGADLVVMGSTARARIIRKILGDVALRAIQSSPVPLFLAQ